MTPDGTLSASALTSDRTHLPAASLSRVSARTREKAAERGQAMKDGCLSGETLVATVAGPRRIDSLLGRQTLLTDHGWVDAEVQCFGVDRLYELCFISGYDTAVVYATANHRWLLADGSWATTVDLAEQVLSHNIDAYAFKPSQANVARQAQQTTHATCGVAVVDVESRPLADSVCSASSQLRHATTEQASTILRSGHAVEVSRQKPVLVQQTSLAPGKPAVAPDYDGICDFTGFPSGHDAELALGTVPLVPRVEISRWARLAAHTTDDVTDMVDRDALAVGSHEPNDTATWKLVSVSNSDRYEPVYCAIVPDLYRFVLANGVLTGNSFPIRDAADLRRAVKAFSRAKDKGAAKRHIIRRAKALGKTHLLPDSWKELASRTFSGDSSDAFEKELITAATQALAEHDPNELLAAKAEKAGVPVAKLKVVYKRGLTAAAAQGRTCVSNEQLAHARVNAFLLTLQGKGPVTTGEALDLDLLPGPPPFDTA